MFHLQKHIFLIFTNNHKKANMNKKDIKESRIKNYFIDSTKEIIMSEGFKAVNVRNVSEKAGYSPATMYSYFKDLNELMLQCTSSFIDDLSKFVSEGVSGDNTEKSDIFKFYSYYTKYFIQYTGIYQLLFLEPNFMLTKSNEIQNILFGLKVPFLSLSTLSSIQLKLIDYAVHGLLLFYLNRNSPLNYAEFKTDFNLIFELVEN